MKLLLWPLLGCTSILLLCEVVISRMFSSTILLMDSFHTIFILMTISFDIVTNSPDSKDPLSPSLSTANSAPTSPTKSPGQSPPEFKNGLITNELTCSLSNNESAPSPDPSPDNCSTAHGCGICFNQGRMEAAGEFMSRLTLSSLTVSYSLTMISMATDPTPVKESVWLLSVGVLALVFKTVVLGLCWNKLQEKRAPPLRKSVESSNHKVNHEALSAEGFTEPGQDSKDITISFHNEALLFSNPGALRTPESEAQTPGRQETDDCLPEGTCSSLLGPDKTMATANTSTDHLDQKESPIFSTCHNLSPNNPESSERRCHWSSRCQCFFTVCEVLLTPVLSVINSTMQLQLGGQQPDLTWMIDFGFSVLALVVLNATTIPQLYRFGRLLLQATPPGVSVSDLNHRISVIPGVLAVHELHIWELTPSFTVATVHVQLHTWFPVDKCADLIREVTKVLQVGGIGCYTVQPDFDTCTECSAADALPSPAPCNLVCGKNCIEQICCSLLEEQTSGITAPSAGEKEETSQIDVKNNE